MIAKLRPAHRDHRPQCDLSPVEMRLTEEREIAMDRISVDIPLDPPRVGFEEWRELLKVMFSALFQPCRREALNRLRPIRAILFGISGRLSGLRQQRAFVCDLVIGLP